MMLGIKRNMLMFDQDGCMWRMKDVKGFVLNVQKYISSKKMVEGGTAKIMVVLTTYY